MAIIPSPLLIFDPSQNEGTRHLRAKLPVEKDSCIEKFRAPAIPQIKAWEGEPSNLVRACEDSVKRAPVFG